MTLVEYVQESNLSDNPVAHQATVDAYLDYHVHSLLGRNAYWMYQKRMEVTYQGNLENVFQRNYSLRNATRVREVMGMFSLLDAKDPLSPHGGAQERDQRSKAGQNHAGGTTNIGKVVLARRIGISRTRERPAPTPSTATSHSS